MLEDLKGIYEDAAAEKAEIIALENTHIMDVKGYEELVETAVELAERYSKITELKEFVDKGIIDDIAIEAMRTFGQLDLLQLTDTDMERSLEGQKDIIESSMENIIADSYKTIKKWIVKILAWIWDKIKAVLKFINVIKKNVKHPLNPKNIENFYDEHREALMESSEVVKLVPLTEIGSLNKLFIDIATVVFNNASSKSRADNNYVDVGNLLYNYEKTHPNYFNVAFDNNTESFVITTKAPDKISIIGTYADWMNPQSVINLIEEFNSVVDIVEKTYKTLDKAIKDIPKEATQADYDSIKVPFLLIASVLKNMSVIESAISSNYKKIRDIAQKH